MQQNKTEQQSGLGIAGMVIGIVSLLLACLLVGGFLGIIGLILSIVGVAQKNRKGGTAIAGIVLNTLAVLIMAFMLLLTFSDDEDTTNETQTIEASVASEETVVNSGPTMDTKTLEKTESIASEESDPVMNKEDFVTLCEEIPYKTLARYPEDNTGRYLVLTVEISQVLQGGWFDDNTYYRVYTDNNGYGFYSDDEYFMYDSRIDDNTRLLEDDIIKVYGEFLGTESVTRALTGVTEEVPAFKAYYIEIIE